MIEKFVHTPEGDLIVEDPLKRLGTRLRYYDTLNHRHRIGVITEAVLEVQKKTDDSKVYAEWRNEGTEYVPCRPTHIPKSLVEIIND